MNKLLLIIEADTNDADYISNISEIDQPTLIQIEPIIDKIKNFKPYKTLTSDGQMNWTHDSNWPTGDCLREDLGEKSPEEIYELSEDEYDLFSEFISYGEHGIHTIKSIKVIEIVNETIYL